MCAILTIDEGNSRGKATLYVGHEPFRSVHGARLTESHILEAIGSEECEGAILSSVGDESGGLAELLRRLFGERLVVLSADTRLPLKITYRTPGTLGADRIAAACGGDSLYPGEALVVADAGSALTVDLCEGGKFLGGNISPGVEMRLRALHAHTARLPEVDRRGELPTIGEDTATAMRCGAVRGAAAEIGSAARLAARRYGRARVLLTGGNASELIGPLADDLEGFENIHISVCDDLVGRGLLRIYLHNENK